jgi:hypothetical protein
MMSAPGSTIASSRERLVTNLAADVAAGEGRTVVLRAGIAEGRTTALRRARDTLLARRPDARSAVCVCSPAAPPYSAIATLLARLGDGVPAPLPPAAEGRRGDASQGGVEEMAEAAWRTVSRSARQTPVLLLIDDAQHIDTGSAVVLGDLGERTAGTAVGIVATAPTDVPLHPALERLPFLPLPGLCEADLASMLGPRAELLGPSIADELLTLCQGHPLVLEEMLSVLDDEQLRGRVPLPRRPRLGCRSSRIFTERYLTLPPRTRQWLLVLALADTDLATSLRAARRLGLQPTDLTPAEAAGLVRAPDTDAVVWPAPLTRVAIAQTASLADLTSVYQALAAATTPETDPVDHARWLVQSLDDAEIAPALLSTAIIALMHGGRVLDAYELALQAAARTRDTARQQRCLVAAAESCWLAGYSEHALRLLDHAGVTLPHGEVGASASVLRWVADGLRRSWPAPDASAPLVELCDELSEVAPRARALGTVLLAGWETVPPASLADTVARLASTYRSAPEPLPSSARALAKVISGHSDPTPAERTALRTVAWWVHQDDPLHPKIWPPPALPIFIGEESEYARQFTALLATAHTRAARTTRALLLLKLATAQTALGHWPYALANAAASMALAAELGLVLHS